MKTMIYQIKCFKNYNILLSWQESRESQRLKLNGECGHGDGAQCWLLFQDLPNLVVTLSLPVDAVLGMGENR